MIGIVDLMRNHIISLFFYLFIVQIFVIRFRASSAEPVQCPIMRSALAGWPGIRLARARQLLTSPLSLTPDARRPAGLIL